METYRSSRDGDHTHASRWRRARSRERVLELNYFISLARVYAHCVTFLKMHNELLIPPIRGNLAISDATDITLVTFFLILLVVFINYRSVLTSTIVTWTR